MTSGVLLDTVKDELLILALGFATKKLADFIKDLKEEERVNSITGRFCSLKDERRKGLAVLIDPDDVNQEGLIENLNACLKCKVDFIFVGGSLVTSNNLHNVVSLAKSYTDIPVVLFRVMLFK